MIPLASIDPWDPYTKRKTDKQTKKQNKVANKLLHESRALRNLELLFGFLPVKTFYYKTEKLRSAHSSMTNRM